MDPPLEVIAALCRLIARETITVRERRRLITVLHLCSRGIRSTARSLGCAEGTVRLWRDRALGLFEQLGQSPGKPGERELCVLLLAAVADAPRPGPPPVYSAEQQCGIVALALRRASFASVEELRERILRFIDYFNRTMARPFKWTYRGRVLQS